MCGSRPPEREALLNALCVVSKRDWHLARCVYVNRGKTRWRYLFILFTVFFFLYIERCNGESPSNGRIHYYQRHKRLYLYMPSNALYVRQTRDSPVPAFIYSPRTIVYNTRLNYTSVPPIIATRCVCCLLHVLYNTCHWPRTFLTYLRL